MRDITLFRRVLRQARPYWLHIVGLFAVGLLASPIALLNPVPLKIVFDSVLGGRPLPPWLQALVPTTVGSSGAATLVIAIGLLLAVTALGQAQGLASTLLRTYIGQRLVLDFRSLLVQQVQRLSLSYHDSRGTADSVYRIQYDAPATQNILVDGAIPFVSAVITVVSMWIVTARLDRQLAVVALAISPPLFFLSRLYRPRMRRQSRQVKKLESSALAVVQETLGALRVVKAFGQETRETGRFVHRSREGVVARIRLAVLEGGYGLVIGIVTALGLSAVLLIGARHVTAGLLTVGQLWMVWSYVQQLYDPLKTMSKKATGLQGYLASAERAFALLDEQPEVPERPHARPIKRAAGAVAFRGVSFAYGPDRPVLTDVSFEIQAGTRLGVVGATGAGKTTLISLLTRFYDPTAGHILLDGVDLRDYRLADLRNQFAIVLQEPLLFSTSIAENIAYARPGASEREIVEAAKAANAHEFIIRLPDGYDTLVGERGAQLSGGERQRIALARAFLKDAPILILDEPTSSVDAPTEAQILQAMERLMSGRTTLLIAHRPSTLEHCEARVELEHGRLAATAPRRRAPRRRRKRFPVRCDASHPVVRAWHTVSMRGRVDRVDLLHARTKSSVYRLVWDGGARSGIAKRGQIEALRVERRIYASVLPRLSSPALSYYGFLPENPREFAWLFIEDAGDEPCSLGQAGSLAARWLGTLHGAAAALDSAEWLPDRGPASYLEHLRGGRRTILANC